MSGRMFSDQQIDVLLRSIAPARVAKREGLSHLEGYDVRATLTRMFGFGMWDEIAHEPTVMLYTMETETKAGKPAVKVAYRASRRLVIRDADGNECVHDGSAVGESTMPDYKRGDAHDMAIKTAETQALKRAAINMGDQFGLSLYKKGAVGALVRKVVGFDAPADPTPVVEDVEVPEDGDDSPSDEPAVDEAAEFAERTAEAKRVYGMLGALTSDDGKEALRRLGNDHGHGFKVPDLMDDAWRQTVTDLLTELA